MELREVEQCFKPSKLAEVPQNLVKLRQDKSCYYGFHKRLPKKLQGKSYEDFLSANVNNKIRKQDLLSTHYKLGSSKEFSNSNNRMFFHQKDSEVKQNTMNGIANKAQNELPNFSIKDKIVHPSIGPGEKVL